MRERERETSSDIARYISFIYGIMDEAPIGQLRTSPQKFRVVFQFFVHIKFIARRIRTNGLLYQTKPNATKLHETESCHCKYGR